MLLRRSLPVAKISAQNLLHLFFYSSIVRVGYVRPERVSLDDNALQHQVRASQLQ